MLPIKIFYTLVYNIKYPYEFKCSNQRVYNPISEVKAAIVRTSGVHNRMQLLYSNTESNDMLGMYKYTAMIGELTTQ